MTDGGGDGANADCLRRGWEMQKTTNLRKKGANVQKKVAMVVSVRTKEKPWVRTLPMIPA